MGGRAESPGYALAVSGDLDAASRRLLALEDPMGAGAATRLALEHGSVGLLTAAFAKAQVEVERRSSREASSDDATGGAVSQQQQQQQQQQQKQQHHREGEDPHQLASRSSR